VLFKSAAVATAHKIMQNCTQTCHTMEYLSKMKTAADTLPVLLEEYCWLQNPVLQSTPNWPNRKNNIISAEWRCTEFLSARSPLKDPAGREMSSDTNRISQRQTALVLNSGFFKPWACSIRILENVSFPGSQFQFFFSQHQFSITTNIGVWKCKVLPLKLLMLLR